MFNDQISKELTYSLVGSRNPIPDAIKDADNDRTDLTVAACEVDEDYEIVCEITFDKSTELASSDVKNSIRTVSGYVKGVKTVGGKVFATYSYFIIYLTRKL